MSSAARGTAVSIHYTGDVGGAETLVQQIDPSDRTVLLKLHGFADPEQGSYTITEDHYIEYLTHSALDDRLPQSVLAVLRNSHLLFLGYSLRDWNVKALLYRLWIERLNDRDWWAVALDPDPLEVKSWNRRGTQILDMTLGGYIEGLRSRLHSRLSSVA